MCAHGPSGRNMEPCLHNLPTRHDVTRYRDCTCTVQSCSLGLVLLDALASSRGCEHNTHRTAPSEGGWVSDRTQRTQRRTDSPVMRRDMNLSVSSSTKTGSDRYSTHSLQPTAQEHKSSNGENQGNRRTGQKANTGEQSDPSVPCLNHGDHTM